MKLAAAALIALAIPLSGQVGGRAARPKVLRPDGPVWDVIRKNCTDVPRDRRLRLLSLWIRPGWQKLIADKHKSAGLSLQDADMNLLTDWLATTFGPNSKPFPRTYIPPEITTFFSDPEAYRLMNRACTEMSRHRPRAECKKSRRRLASHAGGHARARCAAVG